MSEYIIFIVHTVLGCLGASLHYVKKRYLDCTTTDSFYTYLMSDRKSTCKTFLTIVGVGIAAPATHLTGYYFSPAEIYTIIISGYTADSLLNKASDTDKDK